MQDKKENSLLRKQELFLFLLAVKKSHLSVHVGWHILSNYFGMMCTVLRHLIANQI